MMVWIALASQVFENYEATKRKDTFVYVDIDNKGYGESMNMIYHAFVIGLATNRDVVLSKSFTLAPRLRVERHHDIPSIPCDHTFPCCEIPPEGNISIIGGLWAQAVYLHMDLAGFLYDAFGDKAAYYCGNYLFGPFSVNSESEQLIYIKPSNYSIKVKYLPNLLSKHGLGNMFRVITKEDDESFRDLVSASDTYMTYGSQFGWWAQAIRGIPSKQIDDIDSGCFNLTSSQAGSIWYLYTPYRNDIPTLMNSFYVCKENANYSRKFIDLLLL